jgi:hypothetical protein
MKQQTNGVRMLENIVAVGPLIALILTPILAALIVLDQNAWLGAG